MGNIKGDVTDMSMDYHLYTKDERPVTASELAAAAEAQGHRICVLSSFSDWSDYNVADPAVPLAQDVVVCLISSTLSNVDELMERLQAHDAAALREAIEANEIRACDLSVTTGPDWQYEDEAEELKDVYDGKYVSYRKKAKQHYATAGSAVMSGDLVRVLKLIESLRGGLFEDPQSGEYTIDGKEMAWPAEAMADAKITDRRCPKCKKPLPSYRKTCKWCGLPVVGKG